ncbi:hypothetical protein BS78_K315400 [Paspalum vaginatum]|uniref:Uncharacterized protein n=1 Tax=Paspalum vaginatum TaxID=158149 RepID=A0A9W8CFZ8_9POAL|nr:hypothetical protein BS78_K315400 [Paspalum vaginatum]
MEKGAKNHVRSLSRWQRIAKHGRRHYRPVPFIPGGQWQLAYPSSPGSPSALSLSLFSSPSLAPALAYRVRRYILASVLSWRRPLLLPSKGSLVSLRWCGRVGN